MIAITQEYSQGFENGCFGSLQLAQPPPEYKVSVSTDKQVYIDVNIDVVPNSQFHKRINASEIWNRLSSIDDKEGFNSDGSSQIDSEYEKLDQPHDKPSNITEKETEVHNEPYDNSRSPSRMDEEHEPYDNSRSPSRMDEEHEPYDNSPSPSRMDEEHPKYSEEDDSCANTTKRESDKITTSGSYPAIGTPETTTTHTRPRKKSVPVTLTEGLKNRVAIREMRKVNGEGEKQIATTGLRFGEKVSTYLGADDQEYVENYVVKRYSQCINSGKDEVMKQFKRDIFVEYALNEHVTTYEMIPIKTPTRKVVDRKKRGYNIYLQRIYERDSNTDTQIVRCELCGYLITYKIENGGNAFERHYDMVNQKSRCDEERSLTIKHRYLCGEYQKNVSMTV